MTVRLKRDRRAVNLQTKVAEVVRRSFIHYASLFLHYFSALSAPTFSAFPNSKCWQRTGRGPPAGREGQERWGE